MPGIGSGSCVKKCFKYTGDMGQRLAEAHGKILEQKKKEEDKKLKAQLAVVNMFKRSLMKYAKRVAKKEAKKLKAEQKAKKICKSL